jgi:uncharacterized protein (DUF58 family)
LTKLEYATTCAGALAYVLARQGDAVGLATFDRSLDIKVPLRPGAGHLQEILTTLEALTPEGKTGLGGTARRALRGHDPRRMIVVIFTTCWTAASRAGAMARLRARKHDVVLFHVIDPDELDFPFEDSTAVPLHGGQRRGADRRAGPSGRPTSKELARFLAEAETQAQGGAWSTPWLRTDQPPQLVTRFLARRLNRATSAR